MQHVHNTAGSFVPSQTWTKWHSSHPRPESVLVYRKHFSTEQSDIWHCIITHSETRKQDGSAGN